MCTSSLQIVINQRSSQGGLFFMHNAQCVMHNCEIPRFAQNLFIKVVNYEK